MSNENTYAVFTSSHYWGKADSLTEAMKNANVNLDDKVQIKALNCKPDEVSIDGMGGITAPAGTTITDMKLKLSDMFSDYELINKAVKIADERKQSKLAESLENFLWGYEWELRNWNQ